jgi:hypothetical protein
MDVIRLVRTGFAAAIAVALLTGCTLLSGSVTDLAVGDCFDEPQTEGDVSEVQHQPCDQPHDAEVFLVLQHPADSTVAYPVVSGFDDYIGENCVPAFSTYTGRNFETDTEYDLGYFRPTLTGWGEGDREFTCYIGRADGAKLTAPVNGTPTGSPAASPSAP